MNNMPIYEALAQAKYDTVVPALVTIPPDPNGPPIRVVIR